MIFDICILNLNTMTEIRIHGRGGQGVVTASELISIAAFQEGKNSQAFPSFGVERTGAPIEAYARIDKNFIRIREHVYEPDILIVLDATLLETVDVTQGCHKGTLAIVNTAQDKEELNINLPKGNIFTVDATKIALDIFGKNLANTTILGALARNTDLFGLESLKKAIKQKFEDKGKSIINKNIKAVERAYES